MDPILFLGRTPIQSIFDVVHLCMSDGTLLGFTIAATATMPNMAFKLNALKFLQTQITTLDLVHRCCLMNPTYQQITTTTKLAQVFPKHI